MAWCPPNFLRAIRTCLEKSKPIRQTPLHRVNYWFSMSTMSMDKWKYIELAYDWCNSDFSMSIIFMPSKARQASNISFHLYDILNFKGLSSAYTLPLENIILEKKSPLKCAWYISTKRYLESKFFQFFSHEWGLFTVNPLKTGLIICALHPITSHI